VTVVTVVTAGSRVVSVGTVSTGIVVSGGNVVSTTGGNVSTGDGATVVVTKTQLTSGIRVFGFSACGCPSQNPNETRKTKIDARVELRGRRNFIGTHQLRLLFR
jgi:ribosomal protein L14